MSTNSKDPPDCKAYPMKDSFMCDSNSCQVTLRQPGILPDSVSELSSAARGLLLRLLDCDPRTRMRNLRQMQQSAFYMGYNFEFIKRKEVSPKEILERSFPDGAPESVSAKQIMITPELFKKMDQLLIV